jgi:peptide/nickel transport system ATP-binding protein
MSIDTAVESSTAPVLEVDHLVHRYKVRGGTLEAVADVSFSIRPEETLGLVGESGCGKSSVSRAVLQLPRPTSGSVTFRGRDLTQAGPAELRHTRRRLQIIFQDPVSALNPRRTVRALVAEGLVIAGMPAAQIATEVDEALRMVGLDPDVVGSRRRSQLSGGQCQRVAIARAIVLKPDLLICDEPVASLDVSVQGQVLNLLEDMRERLGLAMLFISHDLSVVHNVSDRIAVMYLGKFVEVASSDTVVRRPAHPYTRALIDAAPTTGERARAGVTTLKGELPSPMAPPSGCRFRTRCPIAQELCAQKEPLLRDVGDGQLVACHFPLTGPHDGDA